MTLEVDRIYCGDCLDLLREIEVRGAGATFSLYYACDECCRVWAGVLSPEDEIRAIGI